MSHPHLATLGLDPKLDLVLERTVPVSPARVWRAWTEPESAAQHAAMGFHHGWGAALDQLVELAQTW